MAKIVRYELKMMLEAKDDDGACYGITKVLDQWDLEKSVLAPSGKIMDTYYAMKEEVFKYVECKE